MLRPICDAHQGYLKPTTLWGPCRKVGSHFSLSFMPLPNLRPHPGPPEAQEAAPSLQRPAALADQRLVGVGYLMRGATARIPAFWSWLRGPLWELVVKPPLPSSPALQDTAVCWPLSHALETSQPQWGA